MLVSMGLLCVEMAILCRGLGGNKAKHNRSQHQCDCSQSDRSRLSIPVAPDELEVVRLQIIKVRNFVSAVRLRVREYVYSTEYDV